MANIRSYGELRVYQAAMDAAVRIFELTKTFPSESEAEETRVWLEFARRCGYLTEAEATELNEAYDAILGQPVRMIMEPDKWTIHPTL